MDIKKIDPLIPPIRDNGFLIDQIADITGRDRDEVERRFQQEHRDLGGNVRRAMAVARVKPYVWATELEKFYGETDAFLYETLVWNRTPFKNDMRRWIGQHLTRRSAAPLRVLSFGDGLGIDAYFMAQLGHDVTYFDVSQACTTFARRIFEKGRLSVTMLDHPDQLQSETFDAILCLDVLEHVPKPMELVGTLAELLRPGGELLVHAPFHCVHSAVQTHLRANRRYSGDWRTVYLPHGLRPAAGRVFWNPLVLRKSVRPDEESAPIPWQVALGGAILKAGRYWAVPHNLVGKLLQDKKRMAAMADSSISYNDSSA